MYDEMNSSNLNDVAENTANVEPSSREQGFAPSVQQLKADSERLAKQTQAFSKEKERYLKQISALEDQLKESRALKSDSTTVDGFVDIFSTAHGNATKYVEEIKALANDQLNNAKAKGERIIEEAHREEQAIKNAAREEVITLQKKSRLMLQKANNDKAVLEAQIAEASEKAIAIRNQAEEDAQEIVLKSNEDALAIIIKAKEDAAVILSEANSKLESADLNYQQTIKRISSQTSQIINCAKLEYEHIRSLIEKSTAQYTELCQSLANFDELMDYSNIDDELTALDQENVE